MPSITLITARVLLIIISTLILSCSDASTTETANNIPSSFSYADKQLQRALKHKPSTQRAQGIILFIGDGMSITTVTAARIHAGQKTGKSGEEHQLSFEKFPYSGLSKTYNTNQQTADSAGTMSAMMTGSKTKAGLISVDEFATRSAPNSCNSHNLVTLLETAEQQGWASGIVTTTSITHATPAAAYAHSPERNWESDADLPAGAKEKGCRDIASQLIEFDAGDGIDVVFGGGRQHFLPAEENKSSEGKRQDGRNLIQEWLTNYPKSTFVRSSSELDSINLNNAQHLLGLFSHSHLKFESDRVITDQDEPSLTKMVESALQVLQQHEQFLLIVESGRIDHAHHAGNARRALEETVEFDNAIQRASEMVSLDETLMIVTADHSHTLTMAGYPTRGNPILGFVKGNDDAGNPEISLSLAKDNQPYTTLSYANGLGYANQQPNAQYNAYTRYFSPPNPGRHTTAEDDPSALHYHQESNIPLQTETHAGDDVAIYAQGPWAHLLTGVVEQNYIYHVMKYAGGL